jgi:hypothetical protein
MMLVAIISATTYSVLIFTLEAKARVERNALINKIGQGILKVIARDFEGLYIQGVDNPFEGMDDGTTDYVDFTSTATSYPNEDGVSSNLIEVGYRLEQSQNDEEGDLYVLLRRESYGIEYDPLKGGQLYELYDQVKQFNLQYYDGEEWVDTWTYEEMQAVPLAVKVEFLIRIRTGEFSEEAAQEEEREGGKEIEEQEGYFSTIITIPVATPLPEEEPQQP